MSSEQLILPIIDSHIHLYPASEASQLAWCNDSHELHGQRSIDEYKAATASAPSLLGFVFVETDRNSSVSEDGWELPLKEVEFLRRVVEGTPREGEGHSADDAKLCLGVVPWAPVPAGPEALAKYLDKVKAAAGEKTWAKVKGVRYLVQDKPHGTMLTDEFIGSLKLLGKMGLAFDVGVDQHQRGKKQLDELVEMVGRAHDGVPEDDKVTFILNHLCKPDLTIYNITTDASFQAWRTAMYALSTASRTYMKLSGAFSEMTPALKTQDPGHIFQSTLGWLGVVLAAFGARRIMFGSDWPICTLGGLGDEAWPRWRDVVDKMCWMGTLSDEDRAMIFGGTAKAAYNL